MDRRLFICAILLATLQTPTGQVPGCLEGQWQCDDGRCISAEWKCDGRGDCRDGSDEMDCPAHSASTNCPPGQFACVDSVGCVDESARCDGKTQCPTGSDEEDCPAAEGCLDSEWMCQNRLCVPKELRCDQQDDCMDNSDEEDCGPCTENSIRCPGGTCLSAEKRCDGQVDCSDGSDEPITCGRICEMNNGGCSHVCTDESWGVVCDCPAGYKLSANRLICEDLDECAAPFPPCPHRCLNTAGSFSCRCRDGFKLWEASTCLASGNGTRLLAVQRSSLGLLDVKSQQFEVIQTSVVDPVALAFDITRQWFYWADRSGTIYKSVGQQSWTAYSGEPGIMGLACDWLNGNLFWTNQKTQSIYMQAADGKSYTTLLSKDISPSELVLVPVESLMFWINVGPGDRETIERSWMDGSGRSSVTAVTAQSAHSLTTDLAAARLYWVSEFKRSIETVRMDGTGRYSFTGLFNRRPALGLAAFESSFYWVDDRGLWQVTQKQPSQRKFLWKAELPLLAVYHELQQPQGSSACAKTQCKLCQLTKSNTAGYTCACPNSKVLLPDGTCEYPRFVYNTITTVNLLEFRGKEASETQLFATKDGILSFDVDWLRDWLYWANQTGHIQRTSLTQDKTEVVPAPLPVCFVTVDQRSGSLYWVSCDQNSIGTAMGKNPQRLYHSSNEIGDLLLDWLRGVVYWLEEGKRILSMRVARGKAEELLQIAGGFRDTIAFDLGANTLLWNSKNGLMTASLLLERSHQAGRRWNISGSVVAAFEPYLLTISDNVINLWDRRDGSLIQELTVKDHVFTVIAALGNIQRDPITPVCNKPSVLCRHSSVCLSQAQRCDGRKDCPEGDDEEFCLQTCSSKENFRCRDSRSCISRNLVCDGRAHCFDGSDEVDCVAAPVPVTQPSVLKCRLGSKPCSDGRQCVLYSHICDGERDCEDGSDELECDALPPTPTVAKPKDESVPDAKRPAQTLPACTSPSVKCPSAHICISPRQFCNGQKDCPDGFDEMNCLQRCFPKNDFLCKNRRSCVPRSQVCDGRSQCSDGSDEEACSNVPLPLPPKTTLKCRLGSRLCQDGTECVLYSHVCDGDRDCRDGSDEEGCDAPQNANSAVVEISSSNNLPASPKPVTERPTKPPCIRPSVLCPGSSVCLSPKQICDGKKDCPDGSDEKCLQKCPFRTDFLCKDRQRCVPKSKVCDGWSDCRDGSDEVDCPSMPLPAAPKNKVQCRLGSRLCQDGTECVLYSHICDGDRDCRDGSDEEGCGSTTSVAENSNLKPLEIQQPATERPTKPPCIRPSVLCPGSSVCLSPKQICDGKKDCPDGSDEKCLQRCPYRTDFLCKNRQSCISESKVCDGRSDCYDGSDEVDCPSVPVPALPETTLKCRLGSRLCEDGTECVLYSHVCDGDRDCKDGSDEVGCDGAERAISVVENVRLSDSPSSSQLPAKPQCTSPSVLCPGSSVCLNRKQICDGKKDCPDGSDEKCLQKCPYRTDFLCKDRQRCVSKSKVCDGRSDCFDGSDEVDCPSVPVPALPKTTLKCRLGSRLCQDGTECVLYSHVCDGDRDCQDGSDEEGCDGAETITPISVEKSDLNNPPAPSIKPFTKPPNKASCIRPSVLCPGSSICLSPKQLCDGKKDCPDGSDEKCVRRCPDRSDFRCKDRQRCISGSQVCDGRADCNDGSDEINCPSVLLPAPRKMTLKCRLGSRLCEDGTECVLYSHVCDGDRDCRDGSDEEGCDIAESTSPVPNKPVTERPTKPPCTSPSLLCPDSSVCLSPKQFCDGKKDCPDGSDEKCLQWCPYRTDFLCKDRQRCVSTSQVCDGRSDCRDSSDEVDCPSVPLPVPRKTTLKCRLGSRLCQDGTECVLYSHVCDGERDCRDGSDEVGCDEIEKTTGSPPSRPSCHSPSVLCPGSSVCIMPAQLCDGTKDCPDGSDEDCVRKCADLTDFLCKDRRSCVSRSLVCDGRSHCHDGSDELSCLSKANSASGTQALKCRIGSRLCNDGTECVLYTHVCDGEEDCVDGSDELECPGTCKQGEFQCSHGKKCIPEALVCDGRSQCLDNSDEMNCWEPTKSCEHRCSDGKRCIPKKFLCDGENDCLDGSDERGCTIPAAGESGTLAPTTVCMAPSVLCPGSALCIQPKQLCDGQRDCPDGFDESNCVAKCENLNDFMCADQRKCILRKEVCDGHVHCLDGSDERRCPSEKSPATSSNPIGAKSEPVKCRRGFKPCRDGLECVMYSHVCDGEEDCKDGSDELGCATKCKEGEFQCSHGNRCVPQDQVCDGQYDCQDRSDEMDCLTRSDGCHHHCDNKTRCIPATFLCDGERDCADGSDEAKCGLITCEKDQYRCASGQCLSEALRCDGYADCSDRSDEAGCQRPPRCPEQLQCPHSHECLQKEWLCDGEEDCKDGFDEKNCNTPPAKCRAYQWQCRDSSQCIPLLWRCDGTRDCHNGMDENKCRRRSCPAHLYQCGSGECIDPKLVCNRISNCYDATDEGVGCRQRNCSSPSAPQCDHHCVSTPSGPTCFCAAGFKPQFNDLACVDIDECNLEMHAVCKHTCLNTRGSYTCHCHPGFYLEPDNKSCKTKDEPLLLASVQSELLLLGVHSGTLRKLSSVSRPVFSLDYHWAQQRVYWLSPDYQSVRWADMKDPNNEGTLIKGVKSDFLAVDWVGQNMYWVDGLVGQILAVKLGDITLRSQDFTVVLGEDLEQPSSLVLVPHRGMMFWSEIGSTPQIEQSGMDGSKRKVVVSSDLSWPVSLAYDLLDNRVYWADEKLRCIGSASPDGEHIKILQLAETPNPFSVVVFNDRVFWSDTKRRTVRSAEKNSGKDQKVLLKRPGQPFGLKVMHAISQPAVSSPCDQLPCSHICLLAPPVSSTSEAAAAKEPLAVCRCPKGQLLAKDRITCSLPTESSFVLLLSRNTIYQIFLRSMHQNGVSLKKMPTSRGLALPETNEALGLDASIRDLSLFVAFSGEGSVDVLRMSSSRSRQGLTPAGQILKLKDDFVTALAVDWVTFNLYWSSKKKPDIHVTSRYETHTTSLLQGSLMGTTSIALHPPTGRLCYTAVIAVGGKSQTEVSCAWMDGQSKAVLWRKSSIPTSLVLSNTGTTIYWADTGEGVINSIEMDGTGYQQFKTGPGLLISFTHTANILLWVTLGKDVTRVWFTDGLQPKQLWFETKTSVVEIRAYSNDSQSGENSCSKKNGDCDHLCLPYPGGRTCKCGRGFQSVNVTLCTQLPSCPAGQKSCFNSAKCLSNSNFCNGYVDCPDLSDEQDCPSSNSASSGSKANDDRTAHSPSNVAKDDILSVKKDASCDLQRCNGHGKCIREGKATRCQCLRGYKGESCQEADSGRSHVLVVLGVFCLIIVVAAGVFVFSKRRELAALHSRSDDKENLMANMGLPSEDSSSDSEESESPVDAQNPPPAAKVAELISTE